MTHDAERKFLLVAGAALFFIGLLQGGVVQEFTNIRMALSAHLTAVQTGMALMLAGLVWPHVTLGKMAGIIARWCLVLGMFGLWFGLTLSAATGAGALLLPIAGLGFTAPAAMETIVNAIIAIVSVVITAGWALLLLGLIRAKADG